jgi:hypothetical protein
MVVVIITPFGCVDTIRVVYVEVLDVRAVVGVGLDAWVVAVEAGGLFGDVFAD